MGHILNIEINILDIPNFGNTLIQLRWMEESTRHKWVQPTLTRFISGGRELVLVTFPVHFQTVRHRAPWCRLQVVGEECAAILDAYLPTVETTVSVVFATRIQDRYVVGHLKCTILCEHRSGKLGLILVRKWSSPITLNFA